MECEIHPTLDSFEQQDAEANHPNFTVIRSAFKSSGGRDVYSPCIAVAAGDRSERTEEGIRYSTAANASIFLISMQVAALQLQQPTSASVTLCPPKWATAIIHSRAGEIFSS